MASGEQQSLYDRVGGYDMIAAMADHLLERLRGDPQIGVFWKGQCNDSKRRHRQLLVDFLCEGIGGPVIYWGRDLKTSHDGMGITASDWKVFMQHTEAMLDTFVAGAPEWDECFEVIARFEAEVVEID